MTTTTAPAPSSYTKAGAAIGYLTAVLNHDPKTAAEIALDHDPAALLGRVATIALVCGAPTFDETERRLRLLGEAFALLDTTTPSP